MTKLQRSSVSFWLFFLLCPQCGTALDYYVDCTSGNDGNSGLSVEQPWRTIRKAASSVQGPATVHVRRGPCTEPGHIVFEARVSGSGSGDCSTTDTGCTIFRG